jgi:DNA modification methylase
MSNYNIGNFRKEVYHGDCLDVMPKYVEDKSVDMIFADLPFGTTNCSWDSQIDLNKLWVQYNRVIKDNGVILLFAQTPFDKVLGASNLEMLRYEWIWEKTQATGHLNSKKMPMKAHENILVFYKKLPTYNPIMTDGHVRKVSKAKNRAACIVRRNDTDNIYNNEYPDKVQDYDSTLRFPRSVLKYKSDKQLSNLHKTQKPVELIKYLIKTYTNDGDLVLDNVAGSGTVGVGCEELNRQYILIEKELPIYESILERLNI